MYVLLTTLVSMALGGLVPPEDCPVPTQEILDCGAPGTTQEECLALDCCWNPTTVFVCYQKPVPKLPVGTISDPAGNPINLEDGVPVALPDLIPEDPLVPQVFAEPQPANVPETPTEVNQGYAVQGSLLGVLFVVIFTQ
jgi:hypothetical protein